MSGYGRVCVACKDQASASQPERRRAASSSVWRQALSTFLAALEVIEGAKQRMRIFLVRLPNETRSNHEGKHDRVDEGGCLSLVRIPARGNWSLTVCACLDENCEASGAQKNAYASRH